MKATTDVQEIKQNIQELARRLVSTTNVVIPVRRLQEFTTAERKAGYYIQRMPYDEFIEFREDYIMLRGLKNSPLNEMDVQYMNAETMAGQERWHLLQSILHEIDKLSLLRMREEEKTVVVEAETPSDSAPPKHQIAPVRVANQSKELQDIGKEMKKVKEEHKAVVQEIALQAEETETVESEVSLVKIDEPSNDRDIEDEWEEEEDEDDE